MQIPGLIPETLIQEEVFLKPFSSGSDAGGPGTLPQQHGYRQLIKKIAALPMSVPSNDPRCALALSIGIPMCHILMGGCVALFLYFVGSKERKVTCGASITVLFCFILDNLESHALFFCILRKGVIFSLIYLRKPGSGVKAPGQASPFSPL